MCKGLGAGVRVRATGPERRGHRGAGDLTEALRFLPIFFYHSPQPTTLKLHASDSPYWGLSLYPQVSRRTQR